MAIKVKFFASLRERIGRDEASLDGASALTVGEVWTQATAGATPPGNLLAAVNQEYAGLDQPVHDGDEVAFFPPVTGG